MKKIIIAFFTLIICSTILSIISMNSGTTPEEITKCYDKYNNEIIGAECIETKQYTGKIQEGTFAYSLLAVFILLLMFMILLNIGIIISEILPKKKKNKRGKK